MWLQTHRNTPMTTRRLLTELRNSKQLPESILELTPKGEDSLYEWTALIQPNKSSIYGGNNYRLSIHLPLEYPLEPPKIKFANPIPHSNIDLKTGDICLDILKSENWSPAWTLQTALLAVLVLLDHQEPDSPLNVDMANLCRLNDRLAMVSLINYYNFNNKE